MEGPAGATAPAGLALPRRSGAFIGSVNLVMQVLDRLLAFGQIVLVAAVFGVSLDADRYFLAGLVPLTIGFVVGELLSRVFMTMFAESADRADALAASGFAICAALLVALTSVYALATAAVVHVATPTGSSDLDIWLAFLPIPFGLGLNAFLGAVLLWRERYAWAASRLPIATASGLVFASAAVAADRGVVWFALGTSAGYVLSAVVLYVRVAADLGIAWPKLADRRGFARAWGVRRKLVAPAIGSLIGGQVLVLVERGLAAPLGIGSVAAIAYARGVATAPTAASQAIGAAIYPALVRGNASSSGDVVRSLLGRGLRLALVVGTGIGAYLVLFGTDVIAFLLQRGAFDADSAERAGSLLQIFGLAAVAGSLVVFLVPVLYGLDYFAAILALEGAVFGTFLALALPLRALLGLEGLATAFSLAITVGAVVATVLVARRSGLSRRALVADVLAPVLPRAIALAAVLAVYRVAVDSFSVPVSLDGVVRVGGSAALLLLAVGTIVALSRWPEGERLRSLLRARSGRGHV